MHQELLEKWNYLFANVEHISFLETLLENYLPKCRWFGGKSRKIDSVNIINHVCISEEKYNFYCCIVQCNYSDNLHEWYSLPIAISDDSSLQLIAQLNINHFLIDALQSANFRKQLYKVMCNEENISNLFGFKSQKNNLNDEISLNSKILNVEQSNTSVIFNNRYFFKWFRKVDVGENPDLQTIKFLTEETAFRNIPSYVSHISWRINNDFALIGMMQLAITNNGDAWFYVCNDLKIIYSNILNGTITNIESGISADFKNKISLLGKRTAELHNNLSSGNEKSGFNYEPFDISYQNWIYECLENLIDSKFKLLEDNISKINDQLHFKIKKIFDKKLGLKSYFQQLLMNPVIANKIRTHGDYHLGQVLFSNNDFFILDFEGEPDKPHAMRNIKYTGIRDVAGMIRSIDYASKAVLLQNFNHDEQQKLTQTAVEWNSIVSSLFLDSYLQNANKIVLPSNEIWQQLLKLYLIEKTIYELGYEINNRPTWASIPLDKLFEITNSLS